jgi:hypothetical protein
MTSEPIGLRLLRAARERIEALGYWVDTGEGEYWVSGSEVLASLLDSPKSTQWLVALHYETLRQVSGRGTRQDVVRWVDEVRPVLLAELADDLDHATDSVGAVGGYGVVAGRVVARPADPLGCLAESRVRRSPRRWVRVPRPRGRGPRRRSTSSRRGRSCSPGRSSDEPHELTRPDGGAS